MPAADIIEMLREKMELSRTGFGKLIGFKSCASVWMLEKGQIFPSIPTCRKIIQLAKDYANMDITIEMLREGDTVPLKEG